MLLCFVFPKKSIPIAINSFLPFASLHLDIPKDDKNRMWILVDTRATMNTGNLQYHIWVMSQYPEMVDKFLQCSKYTDYDVIHSLVALVVKEVATNEDHSKMSTVIRYKTS